MSATWSTGYAQLFAAVSDRQLQRTCGDGTDDGALNFYCSVVYRTSGNELLASFAGTAIPALLKIILILVLAIVIHRLLKRGIKRFTRGIAARAIQGVGRFSGRVPLADTAPLDLSRATMRAETMGAVFNSFATVFVWAIAFMLILGAIGVNLAPVVAGAGIVGVALGFGAQNMVKDFLAGLFVILEDQYGIGDIVELRDTVGSAGTGGTVEGISLRSTRVRDVEGVVWHVPNGEIRTAGNKSQQWARSLIDVNVAYGTDLQHATDVIKRTADSVWHDEDFRDVILEEPDVWGLERFDADALAIRLVLKVRPAQQWAVNRALRARIKTAFDTEGIEIPFPQRTVWLRRDDSHTKPGAPEAAQAAEGGSGIPNKPS
ncbi:MAG: mechanosensitive ion channel [Nitriliruptorales bacterium]|nr:mechanosensitive ion channel [Nitriliruptorales bacterium]